MGLTDRHHALIAYRAHGLTVDETARKLRCSRRTVHRLQGVIMRRLNAPTFDAALYEYGRRAGRRGRRSEPESLPLPLVAE